MKKKSLVHPDPQTNNLILRTVLFSHNNISQISNCCKNITASTKKISINSSYITVLTSQLVVSANHANVTCNKK